jgi:hypothetical protein
MFREASKSEADAFRKSTKEFWSKRRTWPGWNKVARTDAGKAGRFAVSGRCTRSADSPSRCASRLPRSNRCA